MRRVFVDSNIFLDYYFDRKDAMLPLGEFAFQFIKKAVECKYLVLVCDLVLNEIENNSGIKRDNLERVIFSGLREKRKLLVVEYSNALALTAKKLSKDRNLPLNDCVFALVARENEAIVVSRDNHFQQLADIVDCFKPENL